MATAQAAAQPDPPGLRKAIAASAMGNAVEWFDYGTFGFLATTLNAVFFPGGGVLQTLMVFAAGFLIRPLGGLILGPLGDKVGRQRILALTIIMMSAATFVIGLLPSYATIGFLAPALLLLCRLIGGFATGGEYGGAATYMAEHSPDHKRGFLGSFLEFGTLWGFTLSTGLCLTLTLVLGKEGMESWGWRIPFLIAGPLGLIGLYLRAKLEDTPVFKELEAEGKKSTSLWLDLMKAWKPLLIVVGMVMMLNVTDYLVVAYMVTYMEKTLGYSADQSLWASLVVYLFMIALIIFIGKASDRIGRKPFLFASAIGFIVFSYPAFWLMSLGTAWGLILGFGILGFFLVLQLGTMPSTLPAMFPTHVRYAGFAIAYNVSTSLFGGTAPAVYQSIVDITGDKLSPAFYVMAVAIIGIIAISFAPETKGVSLRGNELPGSKEQLREAQIGLKA